MNEPEPNAGTPEQASSLHEVDGRLELARVLLMHAVSGVFDGCGNSYANAYTEQWLRHAKSLGAYHGRVIGNIRELEEEWEAWLDENGGLPDWPESPIVKPCGGATNNPKP